MIQKLKLSFFSCFFLSIGLCFSLQPIFWEIHNIAWMTVVVSFGIIPLLDLLIGRGLSPNLSCFGRFSIWVPRIYGVIHFIVLFFYLFKANNYGFYEIPILGLALGTISGAVGITVDHELMHRKNIADKNLAKLILCSVCYGHFFIEHIRGHHSRVATIYDSATAKKNQSLYSFLIQSILGSIIHAWKLEKRRLNSKNSFKFILKNEVIFLHFLTGIFIFLVFYFFGLNGVFLFVIQSFIAVILLEAINYIEHYGLLRKKRQNETYVPVDVIHSWNSNHLASNWILLQLPWHSDHHKNVGKTFNQLKSIKNAPQLPYGYPTMIVIAFFPFIFFSLMNSVLNQNK